MKVVSAIFLILVLCVPGVAKDKTKKHKKHLVQHLDNSNVQKVTFDPRHCKLLKNGNLICDRVVVVTKTVTVE